MKKELFLLFSFISLSVAVYSQDCNPYFNIKKGTIIERETYDAKSKLVNKSTDKVLENKKTNRGFELTTQSEIIDSKGKNLGKVDVKSSCVDGAYYSDISEMINSILPDNAKDKVQITADKIIYPKNLKVGDKLPKAKIEISAGKLINMDYELNNRVVQSKQRVTTKSGTYDCLKITYDLNIKFMGNKSFKVVEYIAPGLGVVKQEQYSKNMKLESSTMIVKVSP